MIWKSELERVCVSQRHKKQRARFEDNSGNGTPALFFKTTLKENDQRFENEQKLNCYELQLALEMVVFTTAFIIYKTANLWQFTYFKIIVSATRVLLFEGFERERTNYGGGLFYIKFNLF